MAENVRVMNRVALQLFRAGHMPIVGEWFALPLVETAGSKKVGDEIFDEIFHPSAVLLGERCDAVLRVGGASAVAHEVKPPAGVEALDDPTGDSIEEIRLSRCQFDGAKVLGDLRFHGGIMYVKRTACKGPTKEPNARIECPIDSTRTLPSPPSLCGPNAEDLWARR